MLYMKTEQQQGNWLMWKYVSIDRRRQLPISMQYRVNIESSALGYTSST
jgi:hypothetical protein